MAEPAWAVATLFPAQGAWTEDDYLALTSDRSGVELRDGVLEVLPMPNDVHQRIQLALVLLLAAYAAQHGGLVRPAGLRLRVAPGRFRMPDAVYLAPESAHLRGPEFWTGADLVVEVVSPGADDQVRDRVRKREEYAAACVRECWLVDPVAETVTVLRLEGGRYAEHGDFARGDRVTSPTFAGLTADVAALLDAP